MMNETQYRVIVPFIMSLYLSYVKTKYFLLFDKDPEKFERKVWRFKI
jgi:hypothetical protein